MMFKGVLFFLALAAGTVISGAEPLTLSENGKTDYVIVSEIGAQEGFAVKELKDFLKQSTGTDFKDAPVAEAGKYPRRIVVGDNALSQELLGEATLASLRSEESLVATKGRDLILAGEGERGTLYAVYSFLENELGCRWYTAYRDIVVPKHETLAVGELCRRELPAFKFRYMSTYFYQLRPERELFFFRDRLNSIESAALPELRNDLPMIGPGCHTLYFYMNPEKKYHEDWKNCPKPPLNNLFESNPAFFSMDASGKRMKLQLCFGNPQLRKTLTSQIEAVINSSPRSARVLTLDANDVPGKFCNCPECLKLEGKYHTPAGPLLDYLLELCAYLKQKHPEVYVKTLAYRKGQSEIPPDNVEKLPDNLIIVFAPIESNFAAPLDHPSNKDTMENLRKWCKIAKNVWVWYYSNPYCDNHPPFGNIEKMARDVKILKDTGVSGTFFEHGSGVQQGFNFAELQTWLLLKLFQNPDQDLDKLVVEFTDYYYGKAAPLIRAYMKELEGLRKEMQIKLPWNPSFSMFTYLTPDRIMKWEKDFDSMEELTKDSPACLRHVRMCRVSLDTAMLREWHEIKRAYPAVGVTPRELRSQIMGNFKAEADVRFLPGMTYWLDVLGKTVSQILFQAEVQPKPLPECFSKFAAEDVRQAFPVSKLVDDADAACGVAAAADCDSLPFGFGFYDSLGEKWGIANEIQGGAVKPDQYAVYKLGRTELTPQCLVWFTGGWIITVPIEQFYVVGEPFIKWDIYVSMKFEGPKFGSSDKKKKNQVFCDRIILIKVKQ